MKQLLLVLVLVFICCSIIYFVFCLYQHNNLDKILSNNNKILPNNNKIPKRIIQTWRTHDIGNLAQFSETWKYFNPNFTYTLFDDADCKQFIRNNFGARFENVYDKIQFGAFKADFWRYCELYINGGVYIDIDTICLGPIDDVIDPNATFVTPVDLKPTDLFNAFIAIVPRHPVMLICINEVVKNVELNVPQKGLNFSGPGLLGMSTSKYLGFNEKTNFVPSNCLYKGIQLLDFERNHEIVYSSFGVRLFQNKNKHILLRQIYNTESKKAKILKYK
jgi:hypothetical protein